MPRIAALPRFGVVLALSIGTCFAFVTDANIYFPPSYNNFMPPVVGGKYTDPVFGTQIKRITDATHTTDAYTGAPLSFITGEYSTMSPFNQNNTLLLLIHQSYFALYDGSGQFIRSLPLEFFVRAALVTQRSERFLLHQPKSVAHIQCGDGSNVRRAHVQQLQQHLGYGRVGYLV